VLVYTSDALNQDVQVTGWVTLTLWVTSTATDTDFMAKVVDVHPDGRPFNICEGARRLALRDSFSKPAPYAPGDVAHVEIELGATGHVFRAGHCIRLQVTSSNFPRLARSLNTGEPFYTGTRPALATQQVLHSSACQSYLTLPIVPWSAS
jgi:putative CocE/NonD family hydrolase